MKLIHICFVLALTLLANDTTFIGKVTQITDKAITVQTKNNDRQEVALSKDTHYEKNGAAATRQDIRVGDRVTIAAEKTGDTLTAHTVRLRTEMRLDHRNPKYPFKKDKADGQNTSHSK